MAGVAYVMGTADTKGEELAYFAARARAAGVAALTVDVSVGPTTPGGTDVPRSAVAACHPRGAAAAMGAADRGAAVAAMAEALVHWLDREHAAGRVAGVAGLGGSGGTALLAPALRSLPVGVPKLLVSTVASGQTRPYVECSDLVLVPSVVDVAGLNRVSRRVLANAASAFAGMVAAPPAPADPRSALGLTMFGVTTPCVTAVRQALEAQGRDCLVFHAVGVGGQAMERLVASGLLDGTLDLTTTEVADEIAGGVFSAGPGRFDALAAAGKPWLLSLGACDMVNFGAVETVPERCRGRRLHVHNAQVTLMRTTPEENAAIARFIAAKVNRSTGPTCVLIPAGGVSALDSPGMPFHDPAANAALFDTLAAELRTAPARRLVVVPHHVNAPEFAAAALAEFAALESPKDQP